MPSFSPEDLIRDLRARRIMVDGGNGNVYDIADEVCAQAADWIEQPGAISSGSSGCGFEMTALEKIERAILEEIRKQNVDPFSIYNYSGLVPPIKWNAVARAALEVIKDYPPVFGDIRDREGTLSEIYNEDRKIWNDCIEKLMSERA